jgi:hypothetical protein
MQEAALGVIVLRTWDALLARWAGLPGAVCPRIWMTNPLAEPEYSSYLQAN